MKHVSRPLRTRMAGQDIRSH